MMSPRLPQRPDFASIEAAAVVSADHRTRLLALIGSLVYGWSNNESMFIYVLMMLLETDDISAAVVFGTLNTTRARLDLVQRLSATKIAGTPVAKELHRLVERFNECTRIRNEFNHCMYGIDDRGEIVHTHAIKIQEARGRLDIGAVRKMDDKRVAEMERAVRELGRLNRDLWDFLPRLKACMDARLSKRDEHGSLSSASHG
jgi:HAMP domain-containing protein